MKPLYRRKDSGFSLIELLVVAAVIVLIVAIAMPTMFNIMANARLRYSASDIANELQYTRSLAVRDNRFYALAVNSSNRNQFFVDLNNNGIWDNGEPQITLSAPDFMVADPSTVPTFDALTLMGMDAGSGTSTVTVNYNTAAYFSSRGLPCTFASPICSSPRGTQAFVYYIQDNKVFGGKGYAAITVTPAGRIKVFIYNGTSWQPN
jgi:prepilin-type N-terminal cleavage/methylation domain-containing protein